ncbi:phage adaptor protein [Bartonella sp. B12(2025)]
MAVTIQTGGPIVEKGAIIPHDKNFIQMLNDIQDEIDDQTEEYVDQVQKAIFSAIRFCERLPFYFNESREIVFPTIKGKSRYGAEENPYITDFTRIVDAYIYEDEHSKSKLLRVDPLYIESIDNDFNDGTPTQYAYFEQKLVLYPIPDRVYSIRLILDPVKIKNIETMQEVSIWFCEAYELIKTRAKYELYTNIIKDPQMAAAAFAMFQEQLDALKIETSRRKNLFKIQHTDF